jgi:hypothetical protein
LIEEELGHARYASLVRVVPATSREDTGLVPGASPGRWIRLFTFAAVQAVARVTNGLLERMEWEHYADFPPGA